MISENSHQRFQQYFFLTLFIATFVVVFLILKPFFAAIVLAVSLGITFLPIHKRVKKMLGNLNGISSIVSVIIVILVVLIPVALISFLIFHEAASLYGAMSNGGAPTLTKITAGLNNNIETFLPGFHVDIPGYIQTTLRWTVQHLNVLFSQFLKIFLETILLLLTLFYFFKSGSYFRTQLSALSPLKNEYDDKILDRMILAVNSIIRGSLIVAVLQGIFATTGLWLFGVPSALIWGVSAGIISLVPGVGTLIVMGPAIVWLISFGSMPHGIGLLIWYCCSLILIDNILSPHIIERGMKVHSLFVLFSILGGLVLFGPVGFILGPMVLAFFFALLDIYPFIFK